MFRLTGIVALALLTPSMAFANGIPAASWEKAFEIWDKDIPFYLFWAGITCAMFIISRAWPKTQKAPNLMMWMVIFAGVGLITVGVDYRMGISIGGAIFTLVIALALTIWQKLLPLPAAITQKFPFLAETTPALATPNNTPPADANPVMPPATPTARPTASIPSYYCRFCGKRTLGLPRCVECGCHK